MDLTGVLCRERLKSFQWNDRRKLHDLEALGRMRILIDMILLR